MKIQMAYKYIGENAEEVVENMKKVFNVLGDLGHEIYCPLFDDTLMKSNKTEAEALEHSLNKINNSEAMLIVVNSRKRSEGMLIEVGYALAHNKKIIVAIQKDIQDTRLRHVADQVIEFKDVGDLIEKLGELR